MIDELVGLLLVLVAFSFVVLSSVYYISSRDYFMPVCMLLVLVGFC